MEPESSAGGPGPFREDRHRPQQVFGPAQVVLLPGESYVEYQLLAQQLRPDSFVLVIGYGESATGYIPTDKHFEEHDTNLADWCWVAPGSEAAMARALAAALGKPLH